jgi:hypothetical protein
MKEEQSTVAGRVIYKCLFCGSEKKTVSGVNANSKFGQGKI